MDEAKGKWVDELPHVLQAYRTTPRRSTGKTPFFMMYSSKAVIPLEKRFPTMRTDRFNSNLNEQLLFTILDMIKERREVATIKLADYHQRLR